MEPRPQGISTSCSPAEDARSLTLRLEPCLVHVTSQFPLTEVLAIRACSTDGLCWAMRHAGARLGELGKAHDRIRTRLWIERVAGVNKGNADETVYETPFRRLADDALRRRMEAEMADARHDMEQQIRAFQVEVDRRMEQQAVRVHMIVEERVHQQIDVILAAEMEKVRAMVEERVQGRVRAVVQREVHATVCEMQVRLALLARENDRLRTAFMEHLDHSDLCFRSLVWALSPNATGLFARTLRAMWCCRRRFTRVSAWLLGVPPDARRESLRARLESLNRATAPRAVGAGSIAEAALAAAGVSASAADAANNATRLAFAGDDDLGEFDVGAESGDGPAPQLALEAPPAPAEDAEEGAFRSAVQSPAASDGQGEAPAPAPADAAEPSAAVEAADPASESSGAPSSGVGAAMAAASSSTGRPDIAASWLDALPGWATGATGSAGARAAAAAAVGAAAGLVAEGEWGQAPGAAAPHRQAAAAALAATAASLVLGGPLADDAGPEIAELAGEPSASDQTAEQGEAQEDSSLGSVPQDDAVEDGAAEDGEEDDGPPRLVDMEEDLEDDESGYEDYEHEFGAEFLADDAEVQACAAQARVEDDAEAGLREECSSNSDLRLEEFVDAEEGDEKGAASADALKEIEEIEDLLFVDVEEEEEGHEPQRESSE